MRDRKKKFLYISGVLLLMALSGLAYFLWTYQILGASVFSDTNGRVFLFGTIFFAAGAVITFACYLKDRRR